MEDWLSQLEMEWDNEDMFFNNEHFMQYNNPEESMDTFSEELALLLGGEDFITYPLLPIENNNATIPKVSSNLLPQQEQEQNVSNRHRNNKGDDSNGEKKKRKREPSQIYDHIMAERKRRELMAQLFIALSAILPGLKKVDKTTILGEAIKHLKQLQEKVKTLEETMAKQNDNVESMVMVVDNDDNDSSCIVDGKSASGGGGGGGDGGYTVDSLPEIEVKVSNKSFLIRVCCEKRKGISSKIFAEVEKHGIIINSNIAPFGLSSFNVTIVAKAEKTDKKHVTSLVKSLHSILRVHPR